MFTKREQEVLDLLVQGYLNREIAEKLIVSIHTVKACKESIFTKLDVHNTVQAVIKYLSIRGKLNL